MKKFTNPTLSLVIPVYNNQTSVKELVSRISEVCQECCDSSYEVILVDDGSHDDSWEIITQLANKHTKGFRLSRNFGQHAALKAGFSYCTGDYIIMMDADLEDDPKEITRILHELTHGCDLCYTNLISEKLNGVRATSKLFQKYANYTNKEIRGKNIGTMRGFNRKVLNAILRFGERRPVYGPLITGLGFKQTVIDVQVYTKRGQQSSYSFKKRASLALDYMIGYTSLVSKFFLLASTIAFLVSFIYGLIIFGQYILFGNQLPPGLSLVVVLLLLLFSILYFGVGVIGMYMQRILHENLQRPLYVVSEITEENEMSESSSKEFYNVRRD